MQIKLTILIILAACVSFAGLVPFNGEKPVFIPPSKQRTGDSREGYKYLTTGDYVKGGIPYDFYLMGLGKSRTNYLKREGLNAGISHDYTLVRAPNGENLVAPNCLQCHAQVFDSALYIGLGNSFMDFSGYKRLKGTSQIMEAMLKKNAPAKYEAARSFLQVTRIIGPYLNTEVRGVNAADRLAYVLAAHRDPVTLQWLDKPQWEIPDQVTPTDVPAWWLLKKKNAMFHNGFGRGDFGRFLMMSNLLTVGDTSESSEVDSHINDVLAYINTLQPPKYPRPVDEDLAKQGKPVFEKNCSKCHGKYGETPEYPNYLIPQSIIKTDSLLFKSNYQNPELVNWFNKSWFARGDHPARLEPFNGYIAPPLDGVWITSPYLHNGSVPTIEQVLNSKLRPTYWSRNFEVPKYDYNALGWQHHVHDQPGGTSVYNTGLPGYGNYGHNFGDKLTDKERRVVIEYLKTL